ncbi:MAG: hypothetical protein II942_01465 [Alphaproteobacteria bacterium]|nr:hypothetical protein [Alphaproteobacteria bacterium]
MTNTAVEQKKSFLQRIRDAYRKRRQEREEDKAFDDFLRAPRGVPASYRDVDLSEFKWTSKSFTLGVFEKIVKMVRHPQVREGIVRDLDAIATGNTGDERVGYIQNRLGYTIFREVTGEPYGFPKFECLIKVQDIINRNFLDLIYRGIFIYKNAPQEIREKFNKAVLPRIKKEKVVSPAQQQTTR